MRLPYTDETITSPDGIACRVLDVAQLDFSAAALGRKSALTLVRCAAGGEEIETKNSQGQIESVYTARAGDAIFINLHNLDDMYVPANADGTRWQFRDLASKGYDIVGDDDINGGTLIKGNKTAELLHEAIDAPTCIKDAWGQGQHAFLYAGATLKREGGRVTGIDKEAFDNTWEIIKDAPLPGLCHIVKGRKP